DHSHSHLHSLLLLFTATPPTELYTLSLHDALPISTSSRSTRGTTRRASPITRTAGSRRSRSSGKEKYGTKTLWGIVGRSARVTRSEEHTSELQSRFDLVCRLLLEKKKRQKKK